MAKIEFIVTFLLSLIATPIIIVVFGLALIFSIIKNRVVAILG